MDKSLTAKQIRQMFLDFFIKLSLFTLSFFLCSTLSFFALQLFVFSLTLFFVLAFFGCQKPEGEIRTSTVSVADV